MTSVTYGTQDFRMPSASLRPWTAYGVYASMSGNPCSFATAAAARSLSGSSYSASTPRVGAGFLANGLRMQRLLGHRGRLGRHRSLLRRPEHALHLGDRDRREEPAEEEKPHEEEPERPDDHGVIEDG